MECGELSPLWIAMTWHRTNMINSSTSRLRFDRYGMAYLTYAASGPFNSTLAGTSPGPTTQLLAPV